MRTTIDLPDRLMTRVKQRLHDDGLTFRALVIDSLEKTLESDSQAFQLRDAAVGDVLPAPVSSREINQLIDAQREPSFRS